MHPKPSTRGQLVLPTDDDEVELAFGRKHLRLTNLRKQEWPDAGIAKRDLLQYYIDISPALLPHLKARGVAMKRYANGASQDFFFMKQAPASHPSWLATCLIEHPGGGPMNYPMIQDLPSLLWAVNMGCIDLSPWQARCDDLLRPDCLQFDLDPPPGAGIDAACEAALLAREALAERGMPSYAKTAGSRGIHIATPIRRGPLQKTLWEAARGIARELAARRPGLITAECRPAKRPANRVLVDYSPNAWGRALASAYSVRPRPHATVSAPVTWDEVRRGFRTEEFRLDNMPERVSAMGDLWKPMTMAGKRVKLA